jgi:hypothetical protein
MSPCQQSSSLACGMTKSAEGRRIDEQNNRLAQGNSRGSRGCCDVGSNEQGVAGRAARSSGSNCAKTLRPSLRALEGDNGDCGDLHHRWSGVAPRPADCRCLRTPRALNPHRPAQSTPPVDKNLDRELFAGGLTRFPPFSPFPPTPVCGGGAVLLFVSGLLPYVCFHPLRPVTFSKLRNAAKSRRPL